MPQQGGWILYETIKWDHKTPRSSGRVRLNENQDFEVSMKELNNLVKACDMEPVARIDQNLASINAAYYIGSGKVGEIREAAETLRADYVVFNDTPVPFPA